MMQSDVQHKIPTRLFTLGMALLVLLALVAFPALGQETADANGDEAESAGAETMETAEMPMIDPDSIVALEFNTYDTGWVRYRNYRDGVFPLLSAPDQTKFPFMTLGMDASVTLSDLSSGEILSQLFYENDMAYADEAMQGECDTERLAEYGDVFCVPGSSAMPPGWVIAALYHPESLEVVALTTSIDNRESIASRADEWRDNQPAAPAAQPAQQQAAADGDGCGPWAGGQWITVEQYQAAGLTLPIVVGVVIDQPTHYQCMIPSGGSPYLEAYTVLKRGGSSGSAGSGGSGGSGGGGGGGNCTHDSVSDFLRCVAPDGSCYALYPDGSRGPAGCNE